jgi:hypothetical protein
MGNSGISVLAAIPVGNEWTVPFHGENLRQRHLARVTIREQQVEPGDLTDVQARPVEVVGGDGQEAT